MNTLPPKLHNWRQQLRQSPTPETARTIIAEYFSFFGLDKAREELWLLTYGTLTSDELHEKRSGRARADLLFFYEFTGMLMEAANCLNRESSATK